MAHRQGLIATDELIGGIAARHGVASAFTTTLHEEGLDSPARSRVPWWRRLRRGGAAASAPSGRRAAKAQV